MVVVERTAKVFIDGFFGIKNSVSVEMTRKNGKSGVKQIAVTYGNPDGRLFDFRFSFSANSQN